MKKCTKCGIEKDESCYTKNKAGKGGLNPQCKACVKIVVAAYYVKNKEFISEYKKEYYQNNKETYKKYYQDNRDSIQKSANKQRKERMKSDLSFRLRTYVSRDVRVALKGLKNSSTWKNLSYSPQDLKNHLENQFEPWMTWENYGLYDAKTWKDDDQSTWTWQLDHIIPHSTFDYTSMEDQAFKDCWDLSNLRPLSAKQNIIEGVTKIRHRK
jgi:hypothetical protein